ncbi:sodium/hydrogen exchanger 9B2 isoform X3 [Halyomorpha halys]|nr:sodium/hydrogen exchanger 9B2 isoform X2 [Halyomorpha halys]XP_014282334.1 sodium/hydrogen exchanger 9B2 isoform X2 [Halyomorpha halys]XP_014282336.1 sodium/hydrogen exchanger 9B2 isoform X2 [Halyomorpha halys]XP_024214731.1 sodium/hydrogen exchanger 9B2 isoform X2 [Halyomorpha halys]
MKPPEHFNGTTGEGELNPGYEEETRRKISIVSNDIERKISSISMPKSILVNGDNLSHLSHEHPTSIPSDHHASFAYRDDEDIKNSWWYLLCTKCRQKETGPGWEPTFWQSVCPYPFCPTYRHVARVFALLLLVILAWGVVYAILGKESAPGGQLFDIAILCICAHIGGWFFRMIALPPLVGMLLVGIVFRNVGFIEIHSPYNELVSVLRKIALVNILIRAGLDLDSEAMKRLWLTVLKIGLLPWILECGIVLVLTHYFLGLPWMWGLLLGSIVAAVSPAVVVPCLFRLRNKGYGVAKGIPTLIIAISGIDDAASVAAFGIIHSIMFSSNSLYFEVLLGLLSIVVGILFGILWGVLASYIPEKDDPFVVPLRILILLGGGLISVLGSDLVGLGGAGPLGCIAAAFLSVYAWTKQGWDVEDNPVATAFEIFWMIFEPILFSLTGAQIKISEMDPNITGIGAAILITAIVLRIIFTILVAFGASLNLKEKIFCGLSLMSKASVQAALGPVALEIVRGRDGPEPGYATIVALICVMSILLSAPVGAILIIFTGSKLLTKTEVPVVPDGWRRSARPSLRDISITDDFSMCGDSIITQRQSMVTEQPKWDHREGD